MYVFNATAEPIKCNVCGMTVGPSQLHNHELLKKVKVRKHLTLDEKIFRISREAKLIERNGVAENPPSDGKPYYWYARMEDVLDVMQPLLRKYKLLLTGNVPKEPITHVSKGIAITEVMVEWTLTDLESSADPVARDMMYNVARTYRVPGSGAGPDDQGNGVSKAITSSRKTAHILIFNLRVADEPEVQRRKVEETKVAETSQS